jgi:hypothetical protein
MSLNLNVATEIELQHYKQTICVALNIDPILLDFINMPDAMGYGSNRVLYARRGAAEVLRKNLGIDIIGLTYQIQEGWIVFTATAKDKSGRQEMAVGASYLQGLIGDRISTSVMTAQTRAIRRVTLQFIGGGILDETEVLTLSQQNNVPTASAALLAGSPTVIPPPLIQPVPATVPFTLPVSNVIPVPAPNVTTTLPNVSVEYHTPLPPHVGQKVVGVHPMDSPAFKEMIFSPDPIIGTLPTPVPEEGDLTGTISPPIAPTEFAPKAPKTRKLRTKPKKSEGFGDAQMVMPSGTIDANGVITPDYSDYATYTSVPAVEFIDNIPSSINGHPIEQVSTPVAALDVPLAAPPVVESVRPVEAQPQAAPPLLTPEQNAKWKKRAQEYYNKIFVDGGMMGSAGIGGPTLKFRKFAQVHAKSETPVLTNEQFEALFTFLDNFHGQFGAHALVAYVNQQIGATQ